jgi:carboxyl-terminal processing protease
MIRIALTFLAFALTGAPARAETALDPAVAPAEVMREIGAIVEDEFYNPEGLAAFQEAEPRLSGLAQFVGLPEASSVWLGTLKTSHTARYTPDSIGYYELADIFQDGGIGRRLRSLFPPEGEVTYPGIGLVPEVIDGRSFAADIYNGGPAARAGIKVGDEILSVDGEPLAEIGSFSGKVGQTVAVQVRRNAGGRPLAIDVPVESIQPSNMLREAIRGSARLIEVGGKRIGYLRLWTFASRGVEDLVMEMLASDPMKDADGLVLDMRGRWGGAPMDATDIFLGRAPFIETTDRDGDISVANKRWNKPIVGIIDSGSRSGMEILAHGLQQAGVTLVGTRTAGAVVAGRAFMLKDNSLMILAVLDVHVDGKRLEGAGVEPEVEMPYDIRYANGADPQLDRAVAELAGQLAAGEF